MVFKSWYIYFQIVKILLKTLAFLAFGIIIKKEVKKEVKKENKIDIKRRRAVMIVHSSI